MIKARMDQMTVEEVANTLTHGVGLLLSLVGFVILLSLAFYHGDVWHIAGSAIYGTSLVVLYAASTVYHSTITPHRKEMLQLVDHCCIYLLIAGSYTPFLLIVLRNDIGPGMLVVVWAFAVFGIMMKVLFRHRFKALGITLYLLLGWLGVITMQPLYAALGLIPLILVLAGGVSYTLGMIFFGWKAIKHHHAIFHVFVLAGSILHYAAIAGYVMPYTPSV